MNELLSVYRHFDKNGQLLYVGLTKDLFKRQYSHALKADWRRDISYITIQHFESKQEAIDAEYIAIKEENPVWNNKRDKRNINFAEGRKKAYDTRNEYMEKRQFVILNLSSSIDKKIVAKNSNVKISHIKSFLQKGWDFEMTVDKLYNYFKGAKK